MSLSSDKMRYFFSSDNNDQQHNQRVITLKHVTDPRYSEGTKSPHMCFLCAFGNRVERPRM